MLTQTELKSLYSYDAETGLFTRLARNSSRGKLGVPVGCKAAGYIVIGINTKKYPAHRLAWLYVYGKFPEKEIDHINMVRDDNRLCNLREATRSENQMNRGKLSNNTSGHKGVSWHCVSKRWKAVIKIKGVVKHLGYFKDIKEAAKCYEDSAKKHFGEFARF